MDLDRLRAMAARPVSARPAALMGFDGFIDVVAHLTHNRTVVFDSMTSLGSYLVERKESNCSLDMRDRVRKLGGNAPICANALACMGVPVDCVGAMGRGEADPAFAAMHPLCSLYPVAQPGECLALEFKDSKLFLADTSGPALMTWEAVLRAVGPGALQAMADRADLIGIFNWGELENMQEVWEGFSRTILQRLTPKPRTAVFDLSDCSGRTAGDVLSALSVISSFKPHMRTVLSANDNEIFAVARAAGYRGEDVAEAGAAVFSTGAVDMLVHHSLKYARIYDGRRTETVNGIHIDDPVLVTGGGDHFNAGLSLGLLCGLSGAESALLGNTVSRLYVSTGESPSLETVLDELESYETIDIKEDQA